VTKGFDRSKRRAFNTSELEGRTISKNLEHTWLWAWVKGQTFYLKMLKDMLGKLPMLLGLRG
jgi:hypothetical protein